jgi:exonuclease SbcD
MIPFCFIHAADLHLDTPFVGLGKIDGMLQQRLRDASLEAFDNLIRAAVERHADFVVLAGDIYDGAERGARAQARFIAGMRELDRNGIACLFIHGNHDPIGEGWSALRPEDFPASAVLIEQCDEVRAVPVTRDGQVVAMVHGISFRTRKETRNLSRLFPVERGEEQFHVGLLHCNVGGQAGHDNYAPCTLEDLCNRAIDYWALGHIHKRMELKHGGPVVLYPGNVQGRSFDECGPKGATLVRVGAEGHVELEPLALDVVRFAVLRVDVSKCRSLDEVLAACEAESGRAMAEAQSRLLLARILLHGQSPAHRDLLLAEAQEQLLPALRDRLPAGGFWLDRVIVDTVPVVDRAEVARSTGFEAALVKLTDKVTASDQEAIQLLEKVQAPLLTGRRFEKLLPELGPESARAMIQGAEARLLGLLETESGS